jgi:rod shape-determining protein MreD
MTKEIIRYTLIFLLLVLAQVVVFNHICLFNVAIPLVFIYFLIKLPVTLGINWVMTLAFVLGVIIDMFSNTQGMNALSCLILAVLRIPVLHLYFPRQDDLSNPEPSVHSLGLAVYMKYAGTLVAIYCLLFFLIEAFTFFDIATMILRVVSSSILTFVIILAFEGFSTSRR